MSNILKETKGGVNKIVAVVHKRGGGGNPMSETKIRCVFLKEKNMQNVLKRKIL